MATTYKWAALETLGVTPEQQDRNSARRVTFTHDGCCLRCCLPVRNAKFWASHTTRGLMIPKELVADYPTEGEPVPAKYVDFVNLYGPGMGLYPVGSECAKLPVMLPYAYCPDRAEPATEVSGDPRTGLVF